MPALGLEWSFIEMSEKVGSGPRAAIFRCAPERRVTSEAGDIRFRGSCFRNIDRREQLLGLFQHDLDCGILQIRWIAELAQGALHENP